MSDPYATAQDVADRWRPLTAVETARATVLLADASALIRAKFPGIDAQVQNGTVDATVLAMVAANMVKRALIAPEEGVTQASETVGPYSSSRRFENPNGNLYLTAAELSLIVGDNLTTAYSGKYGNTTTQPARYWY